MFALLPTKKSEVLIETINNMVFSKIFVASAVVFAADVQCFRCHSNHAPLHRTSLSAKADEEETASKGGAGSWRAKAKEFLEDDKTNTDVSDRKLDIAFVTGNAMKQKEINLILSKYGTTDVNGDSYVNLRILDVDLPEIQGEFW